ncbi:amidohydrolase [Ethanoligenens sp.]|uniref:amidohydrolase n=1 Tax=Ethanoligenens sp. TaxID=2099655 RepID=UPI0039E79FF8
MSASYVLKSTSIFDGVSNSPISGGVVIEKNRIKGVYAENELMPFIGKNTKVLDFDDKLIMPGFIDSHTHTGQAMDYEDETFCIDIGAAKTFPSLAKMMQDWGAKHPEAKIIFGTNYNFFNLEDRHIPTLQDMDAYFPDRPALLQTWEIHSVYANSKALAMAGITKETPDPNNGIGKDENGELNGVINDTAAFALQRILMRPLEEREASLVHFMNELNRYGITSVGDLFPCGPEKPYALYKAVEDKLTVRIHFYPELLSFTPQDISYYKTNFNTPMLQFSGLKNLIDGVISVHTAWMTEPYADDPLTSGFPAVQPEIVREKMLEALGMGVNVRIHTIGDKAVHYVLDVYEEAEKKFGRLPRRNVMEHLEYVLDEDIPRFAQLGVVADMQGRHITFYVDEAARIMGEERAKLAFRWRDIYDTGAVIGTGTDYPVIHFSPFPGIYAAMTRKLENGYPESGWLPEQCMTLPEMLKICTIGSACALNRDEDLGTLEPGKLADITILDRNLFKIPTDEILDTMPVMTMVDGNIVFQR